jgi:hypothetical protein
LNVEKSKDSQYDEDQTRIQDAKRAVDRDYLILGRELYVAFSTGKYKEDGFSSFDDYAVDQGVDPGRAKRLRRVFKKYSKDLGISFTRMLSLGYERLKVLEPVINRSNKEIWLRRAAELDYPTLIANVKIHKKPRRRRREVKQISGALPSVYQPEDAAALISKIPDERLKPSIDGKSITDDDVVFVKTIYLIGDQKQVFETALENMERRTGSTKIGYLLTSALQEFLAHEALRGIKDDKRMRYFMNILERRYKGQLIWVRDKKIAAKLEKMINQAEEELTEENDPAK